MKIKILGTGSIYSKSVCASLIVDKKILVDIGPGVIKQLLKENYDLISINTILITHLHSNHILDFPNLIVNIEVLKLNHIINIYAPFGAKERLLKLLNLMYGNYFDDFINKYLNFIVLNDDMMINTNTHNIKVKEVIHTGIKAYGFIVDSKLGITGDSSLCDGVKKIVQCSHVVVCDCSLLIGDIYHMGTDDIKELLKIDDKKKFLLSHFRGNTKEKVKNMKLNNVLIVEDGYEFELE